MNDAEDRISLGGWKFAAARLQSEPGAERDTDDAAGRLRELIENPDGIEPLPRSGWLRLIDSEAHIVFGCRSEEWGEGSWVTVAFERYSTGRWQFRGSSYGDHPKPTRADVGAGLRLAWPTEEFHVQVGHYPQLSVLLVNDCPVGWTSREERDLVAIASLRDLSTHELFRPSAVGVTGSPHVSSIEPGQSIELGAVLATEDPPRLPPGTYGVEVTVWNLGLALAGGRLRVWADDNGQ